MQRFRPASINTHEAGQYNHPRANLYGLAGMPHRRGRPSGEKRPTKTGEPLSGCSASPVNGLAPSRTRRKQFRCIRSSLIGACWSGKIAPTQLRTTRPDTIHCGVQAASVGVKHSQLRIELLFGDNFIGQQNCEQQQERRGKHKANNTRQNVAKAQGNGSANQKADGRQQRRNCTDK